MLRVCSARLIAATLTAFMLCYPAGAVELTEVGRAASSGVDQAVVQGDWVFRTLRSDRRGGTLMVHDLSDPSHPRLTATVPLEDYPGNMALSGDLLAVGDHWLRLLDVSNPESPVDYGTFPQFGYVREVALAGDTLYATTWWDGLLVIDVSDPAAPLLLGSCAVPFAGKVSVGARGAVVADTYELLHIVDLADPTSPTEVATWGPETGVYDFAAQGDSVVVNMGTSLTILDLSVLSSPEVAATYAVEGELYYLTVAGDRAYVLVHGYEGDSTLVALDISNPARPREVASLPVAWWGGLTASDMQVLMYSHDYRLLALDAVSLDEAYETPRVDPMIGGNGLALGDGYAYVTSEDNGGAGLSVVDIRNPAAPVKVAEIGYYEESFHTVMGTESRLYTSSAMDGQVFSAFDLSDPVAPTRQSLLVHYSPLARQGDRVYATIEGDLVVLDVTDATTPVELGRLGFGYDAPMSAAACGRYLYAVTPGRGLLVIDASDPAHMAVVGELPLPPYGGVAAAAGSLVCIIHDVPQVRLIDVSDPWRPVEVWSADAIASGAVFGGSYLYLDRGSWWTGYRDVSVVGLTAFSGVGLPDLEAGNPSSLAISGNLLYHAAGDDGLRIYEIVPAFSDLSVDHWALAAVESCHYAGLAGGYSDGTYRPTVPVTRAQMAVFLARALAGGEAGVPPGPGVPSFCDVPKSHWACKYVEYLRSHGIATGYGSDFRPDLTVDRAQMAVFVVRAVAGGDAAVPPGPATPSFSDVPMGSWAFRHIEYAKTAGIVSGYWDGYHPERVVARDQMAVFLARAFDLAD